MDLSIIIINYKTFDLTKQTINSIIFKKNSFGFEIIVVDNNSEDGSYEKLKNAFSEQIRDNTIKLIANHENQGFAAANNIAIKLAQGDFILLLNSDTVVKENSISSCLEYIEKHDDVGAIGCKILLPNGKLDKACKRSFPNPKNSFYKLFSISKLFSVSKDTNNYNLNQLDDDGVYEVDSLVGAFMLVRKSTINQIGLLDENFFMYGEDIDWCFRIKKARWKIIYYGKSEIIHYKGSSSKKQKNKLIYEFNRAMYIFYKKHCKNNYSIFTNALVYFGIGTLLLVNLITNIFKGLKRKNNR